MTTPCAGNLARVAEANTGTTQYNYDAVGNLASFTQPNGVTHAYTYDTQNRLTNLSVAAASTPSPPVAGYAYTLDNGGHRTSAIEKSGRTINYTYDTIYRLTSETIANDPNSINGAVGYSYDNVGNRLQQTSSVTGISAGLFNYGPDDRISTDTYDANGNTLTSAANPNTNVYDFENRLIQQGAITIVYDGDGNRVQKSVAGVVANYLVDDGINPTGFSQVILEDSTATGETQYVFGLERLSERYQGSPSSTTFTSAFYGYDGHGSVRFLTDSTGGVTDTYDYDAFGNLLHITGTTPNVYRFAGEQFDPDLGLYYNRTRYLNVSIGRFWTTDSYEGNASDPASLHKYLYANADPVDLRDPAGNTPLSDFIAKAGQRGIEITARAYGVLAHTLIESDIEATYPEAQIEVPVPGGRIDVYIPPGVYEVKPLGGVADPEKQLDRYLGALPFGAVRGTIPFDKTIVGPLVFDKIHYFLSSPGVILYDPSFDPTIPTLLALATVTSYAADLAASFGASLAVEALAF